MDYSVLNRIDSPADLRKLDSSELARLAEEIRDLIVRTTSETGGHLASSLGAVEIAIAIHRSLDTPRDMVIWDVGHQAYAHKILTGRRDEFHTLRRHGGIGGFPRRAESEYDVVDSGHAGSSVSYGVGLALARDKLGLDYAVASVIGDGSMTSGVAYEAMNQAGHHLDSNLIIILNDNEMSISKNVGGVAAYLSRMRIKPGYTHLKEELEELLKTMPAVGDGIYRVASQLKDTVTHALVPGMLFESLGLKYVGPIDGHDLQELEETIREARWIPHPVLVHAITRKGKGYGYSESRPELFHGVSSFDRETGRVKKVSGEPTYTELFGEAMVELGKKDDKIVAVTAAMKLGTGLERFARMFPERFFDVGIAEQFGVNLAAGLALGGLKPVVAIYSTFLQRAFDQLSQEVCLNKVPVVLAVDRAGLVGEDGATHHGYFDISYLRMLPNMTVMAPGTGAELPAMLEFALGLGSPAAVRFPRSRAVVGDARECAELSLGRGEIVRPGSDITLLALGDMVPRALEVALLLEESGLSAGVVNARFAKPIDESFIAEVTKDRKMLVTLEDNVVSGGFGSGVTSVVESLGLTVPVLNKGLPDDFVDHGTISELFDEIGLSAQAVTSEILERLGPRG
jgi:1-deoxy-D-xylulose-5-phosphate synthase